MPKAPRKHKYESIIEQSCGQGETLLLISRPHWIFLAKGLFWLVSLLIAGIYLDSASKHWMVELNDRNLSILSYIVFRIGNYILTSCLLFGLIICLIYFATYFTTLIGLTTKRLMIRKGLLFVKMINVDIEEIKGEYVDNGMFGSWLNYGEIHMDARFVANFYVPNIADPYRLIRAMNETRAAGGNTVIAGQTSLKPAAEVGEVVPLNGEAAPVALVAPPAEGYAAVQQPVVVAPVATAVAPQAANPPPVMMRAGDLPADMQVAVSNHSALEPPADVKMVDKLDPAAKKSAADLLDTFTAKS